MHAVRMIVEHMAEGESIISCYLSSSWSDRSILPKPSHGIFSQVMEMQPHIILHRVSSDKTQAQLINPLLRDHKRPPW